MIVRARLALVLALSMAAVSVHAEELEPLDEALQAYQAEQYSQALSQLRALAARDDPVALFYLGVMYAQGLGIEADAERAREYYRRAGERGHVQAQYNLGLMEAERGEIESAMKWWRRAADQGSTVAQYNLGAVYHAGKAIPRDSRRAFLWWRRAARAGFAPAQYNLASLYYYGEGTEQDRRQALQWYRAAAEQGDDKARAMVERLERNQTREEDPAEPTTATNAADWLQAQSPSHYTIQLLAARSERNARRYARRANAAGITAREVELNWGGAPGYVVLYGSFADAQAAQRAAATLPQRIKPEQPWIRRFRAVQAEMEKQD